MNEYQQKQFEAIARQMIEWLCNNGHPHMSIIITSDSAELLEGVMAIHTTEFVKD